MAGRRFMASCTAAACLLGGTALAAGASSTMSVTPTLVATCPPLAFGIYTGPALPGTATVTCTATAPFNIGLDGGTTPSGSVTHRLLYDGRGGTKVLYSLSRDAAHAVNWGNTPGTDTAGGIGSGAAQQFTVYGQMRQGKYGRPDGYTNKVHATVTY